MDHATIQTLVNGLISAFGLGGTALLFGVWDRRRQSRNEKLAGNQLERKELSENWREYLSHIEAESERRLARLRETEKDLDQSRKERDWVWGAFRKFETLAYALRHEAMLRIWDLHFKLNKNTEALQPLPDLPSGHSLYNAEKEKSQ